MTHPVVKRTVHYTGRVQGVGFRATAAALAGNRAVTGYVRNLPDGRVELVAEGAPRQLDEFLDRIVAEFRGNIADVACDEAPAGGEFPRFDIRL